MATITKRLHISGLTPSLTPEDLSKRFSSFGTVKAIDGFGLSDGVGQPRKFGYLTVEATPAQLAKCLNSLSGSTWKGAKLRIGDARPDYNERLKKERAEAAELPPPKKRQRFSKYTAVNAPDMDLVTIDNVADHPGWTVTSSGRLLRPMKMRPGRPLPPTVDDVKKDEGKKKRKVRTPDTRARKKAIDVTRWGGQRLKGVFLENLEIAPSTARKPSVIDVEESEESDSESDTLSNSHLERISPPSMPISAPKPPSPPVTISQAVVSSDPIDLAQEKLQTLTFIESLFGEKEWGGEESVSDVEDVQAATNPTGDFDMDYEVVPKDDVDVEMEIREDEDEEEGDDEEESSPMTEAPIPTPGATSSQTKLKDLFAPRAEEAGFSLLGHLDLDDEFDEDVPFSTEPVAQYIQPPPTASSETYTRPIASDSTGRPRYVYDPTAPFFFPRPGSLSKPNTFHRTETEEQIRQNWENKKGELTRLWKKRYREATKIKRRRGGNEEENI